MRQIACCKRTNPYLFEIFSIPHGLFYIRHDILSLTSLYSVSRVSNDLTQSKESFHVGMSPPVNHIMEATNSNHHGLSPSESETLSAMAHLIFAISGFPGCRLSPSFSRLRPLGRSLLTLGQLARFRWLPKGYRHERKATTR